MKQIVDVHHPNLDAALLDQVLIKFYWLRGQNELRKKPSTSELVDWISALLRSGVTQSRLEAHIPFLGSLLKNEQDTESLLDYTNKGGELPRKWGDLGSKFNQ
jgi:MoxR-like ATPase